MSEVDLPEVEPLASTLTPVLALPYPSSSDPVAAGAANIRDLALALDTNARYLENLLTLTANATLRKPRVNEVARLMFPAASWAAGMDGYGLFFGDGSLRWQAFAPVRLSTYDPTALVLAAGGPQYDASNQIQFARPVFAWTQMGCVNTAGTNDMRCGDFAWSGTYDFYVSAGGVRQPMQMAQGPFGRMQTKCNLAFHAGAAATVQNRSLQVFINIVEGV
jgi:hypothetical protein